MTEASGSAALPPLPTDQEAWEMTVRLHRNPGYLRALADDIERRNNGERISPDARSLDDIMAGWRHPSPKKLRERVAHLRSESARLAALADEIEGVNA